MPNGVDRMSRRVFLRGCATVGFLVAAPSALARKAGALPRPSLTRSRFTRLVGARFTITGAGENTDVVLAEVNDLSPVLRAADEQRFALLFRAPAGHAAVPSGTHTFRNDEMGEVVLFVSAVDRGVKARHYEAIFNRA